MVEVYRVCDHCESRSFMIPLAKFYDKCDRAAFDDVKKASIESVKRKRELYCGYCFEYISSAQIADLISSVEYEDVEDYPKKKRKVRKARKAAP